jgi:hypothetical protein
VLAASVPAGAILVAWEIRLARRGGEPVLQVQLLRQHRSFALGQALALLYFAGFTSLFFTLSILWQQGLGRSALQTGLLVLPFAVASLSTASNSYRFSTRFGRKTVQGGLAAMFAGLALVLLVLHLTAPRPDVWALIGPLFLAGLGNGLVIAPNQDFVLGSVPKGQAGTAGGALITAQRIGAAIGIAVIGTALFGSGSGSGGQSSKLMPSLAHTAQTATIVNLAFVLAAWLCTFGLPRTLAADRAEENALRAQTQAGQARGEDVFQPGPDVIAAGAVSRPAAPPRPEPRRTDRGRRRNGDARYGAGGTVLRGTPGDDQARGGGRHAAHPESRRLQPAGGLRQFVQRQLLDGQQRRQALHPALTQELIGLADRPGRRGQGESGHAGERAAAGGRTRQDRTQQCGHRSSVARIVA